MTSGSNQADGALILVVDDDARNAKLLARILETEGLRARVAPDGETALALIAAQPPDMVLLDVMMPGLDGYSVCARIKEDELTRGIPVLLVTALTRTEDKVRGLDAGADDFIAKPINRAELLARVRTHFRIKRLRDEVAESRMLLEEKNRRLTHLEKMREDLTHMIAHDLKSPLAAIQLGVDMMRDASELPPRLVRSTLESVDEATGRLTSLVRNLLDVARLEQAKVTPHWSHCQLTECMRALAKCFDVFVTKRGGLLHCSVEPGAERVVADSEMVSRILENLVSNAIRATGGEGEVTVIARPTEDGGVELAVGDHGPGVPEELRERIFDKFSGVEASQHGLRTNHGLGLTFCKLATEAHAGRIWVEPREGGGCWFRFTLPHRELPRPEEAPEGLELAGIGA